MRALRKRFGARADGGISPIEATKRRAALDAALKGEGPVKVLPPAMPHFGGVPEKQTSEIEQAALAEARAIVSEVVIPPAEDEPAAAEFVDPAAFRPPYIGPGETVFFDERGRRLLDHPVVTITITGLPRSGKSVIAHIVRTALAVEGIVATGPDELRPIRWRGRGGALDNLIDRGVSVVLVKREAEERDAV